MQICILDRHVCKDTHTTHTHALQISEHQRQPWTAWLPSMDTCPLRSTRRVLTFSTYTSECFVVYTCGAQMFGCCICVQVCVRHAHLTKLWLYSPSKLVLLDSACMVNRQLCNRNTTKGLWRSIHSQGSLLMDTAPAGSGPGTWLRDPGQLPGASKHKTRL